MKRLIALANILILIGSGIYANAQEPVPRRDAVRLATYLNFDLSVFDTTPIPSDADVKRPVAYREGEYAALIVPESKLNPETFVNAGSKAIVPVGQIWMHKIVPTKNGEAISGDSFKTMPVTIRDETYNVMLCLLGARKKSDNTMELLIFGKDKEPLLTVPLIKTESKQDFPIEADVQRVDNSAKVILKIVGKYQATFEVTSLE